MTIAIITHNLRTQDNHITDNPIFVVEQKRRITGFAVGYTDDFTWIDPDGEEVSETNRVKLERYYDRTLNYETKGYSRTGYRDVWVFVTACLTEQGCKDYLRLNGHNLGETRIYVYSGYRNEEWRAVREHLVAMGTSDDCT